MTNKLQNTRIEFHILQSFPVSCFNRDDVGSPKSALIGGTQRARVSSQCWKRAIRLAMHEYLSVQTACRTRLVEQIIAEACIAEGATEEQAQKCGKAIAKAFKKKENAKDTLFFISKKEAEKIAQKFKENFDEKNAEANLKEIKVKLNSAMDGLDIALFGRMAANVPDLNVEAAASVAHAISTHKVASEVEFFTAVNDVDKNGPGHMDSLEFNSATYYRYISLDLGQLLVNLGGDEDSLLKAVENFTKAIYLAIPTARQATMTASTIWDYAKVFVRKGQRIQASFEDAVTARDGLSILAASKKRLQKQLSDAESKSGSLFDLDKKDQEKSFSIEFGENADFSIDDLVEALCAEVSKRLAQ